MTPTMYGIRNCDTVRKARAWLDDHGIAHGFHDYRRDGVDRTTLLRWVDELGWEALLNRAGTTFRRLPEAERAELDRERATALMLAHPSAIRRPVLDLGERRLVGFRPELYAHALAGPSRA
ncbi:ArsC family reductase [Geminicoccus flavidas]|uniref:ArsC family reductase n=1 Tax=Geminicoccus flavidas TaxID=2506407 RepID=UPI001358569B|nr:ArsC family reductase [Geminicoccus flavidas]